MQNHGWLSKEADVLTRVEKRGEKPTSVEVVDARLPSMRLVSRVEALVKRADKMLKDAGRSGIERLRREADAGDREAIRLRNDLNDLRAFQKNPA